jgi:hypothetical protein
MRITIIPEDKVICIDGYVCSDVDVSWIPEFVGNETGISTSVHAVQWYDNYGHIELKSTDHNIHINELGIFEKAIEVWEEKKQEILKKEEEQRIAAEEFEKMIKEEEEARKSLYYNDFDNNDVFLYDIEELLKEI